MQKRSIWNIDQSLYLTINHYIKMLENKDMQYQNEDDVIEDESMQLALELNVPDTSPR